MNQRIIRNIILLAVFVLVEGLIILPFISWRYFNTARSFEKSYQWEKAQAAYQRAIAFSPFDTQNFQGLADSLLRQSFYREDKVPIFKRSEGLYQRALELNPYNAEYAAILGQLQIALFLKDKKNYGEKLAEGIKNLKLALRNDPKGVNISYRVGYTAISVWGFLDENDKILVLSKLKYVLKYALKHKATYINTIYRRMWQALGDFSLLEIITPENLENQKILFNFIQRNNFWQFRKKQMEVIDFYWQKEDPQGFEQDKQEKLSRIAKIKQAGLLNPETVADFISAQSWQGKSRNGKNVYKNGNMFWNGTIDALLKLSAGESMINIRAKGSPADNIYPYMIVELDGWEIGECFIDSSDWKDYSFKVNTEGGIKVLSITYINDGSGKLTGGDINLFVGSVKVTRNE